MKLQIQKIPILKNWLENLVKKYQTINEFNEKKYFELVRDVILEDNILLDAMAKQRLLLLRQNRKPIAIFISTEVFNAILDKETPCCYQALWLNKVKEGITPLTNIAKIFVYVNPLLKDASLLVVGSITWKSEVNSGR